MVYKNFVLGVKDHFRRFGNNSEGLDQGFPFIQVYGLRGVRPRKEPHNVCY